ncbi:MAG: hypothetical protein J6T47_09900, partial [Lachnospiraceae bacterium]|nr:hypothetical protein [Lachnospiraceae bacterium]
RNINRKPKQGRRKATSVFTALCMAFTLAACESGGPGDAIPELETPKQSTIGVPRPTGPVYPSVTAFETTPEASAPAASDAETASSPEASLGDVTAAPVETTAQPTTEAPTGPTVEVIDTDYEVHSKLTDDMYDAAASRLGTDNTYRMAHTLMKAQAGQPVTIVLLGGSSYAGDGGTKPEKTTEAMLYEYWKRTFPASELSIIRDTQSYDDPYFAIHRAALFVATNPDLVLIDYSAVDDGSEETRLYLENLVHRYLTCDSQPAVMFLYIYGVMQQDDSDSQRIIATRYRLPMLSYGDAIEAGISAEVIPDRAAVIDDSGRMTDTGHAVFTAMLERYFNTIRAYIRSDKYNTSYGIPESPTDATLYSGSHIADNENVRPSSKSGIAKGSRVSADYPNGWTSNAAGFELRFKITSRNLGILYHVVPDASGAEVDVYVDGLYVKTFSCSDPELTQARERSVELYSTGAKGTHIVTLRQKAGSPGSVFALLALLVS